MYVVYCRMKPKQSKLGAYFTLLCLFDVRLHGLVLLLSLCVTPALPLATGELEASQAQHAGLRDIDVAVDGLPPEPRERLFLPAVLGILNGGRQFLRELPH